MKRQHSIISVLAVSIVVAVAIVGLGTSKLFQSVNNGKRNDSAERTESSEKTPVKSSRIPELEDIKIDEAKNKNATVIDEEATQLLKSDPSGAQTKFLDAAKAYRDAGNLSKASEMEANAMTAQLLAQQKK